MANVTKHNLLHLLCCYAASDAHYDLRRDDDRVLCALQNRCEYLGIPTCTQNVQNQNISDKAVSKWERGLGCPEVSLLPGLSKIFDVDLEKLLSGEQGENEILGGNMITSMADTNISCCGKRLKAILPQKAGEDEKLSVEIIENDFFITSNHSMIREHYIVSIALLTGDSVMVRKQYPEWDLQVRIPIFAHGKLMWYCTKHGLFYQEV